MKKSGNNIRSLSRLVSCFVVLLVTSIPSFPSYPSNELDQLIGRIEGRYGRMRGLAADFEQTFSGPNLRTKRERGRVFIQRPRRMRWEYEPKPGKLFVVNEREVWFYSPADREAIRANATKIADVRFPFLFLLGQRNLRGEFSDISFAMQDSGASGQIRTLRLIPKRKNVGIREIIVEVTRDGRISKIRQVDDVGAVSEFSLMNVQEDYISPAEAFEFKPPPGVNVKRQT